MPRTDPPMTQAAMTPPKGAGENPKRDSIPSAEDRPALSQQAKGFFGKTVRVTIVPIVAGLLLAVSDKIIEDARNAVNRSDMRKDYFEKLAFDLANYVFCVEDLYLTLDQGLDADASKKRELIYDSMKQTITPYNAAFTTMRKGEYYYRAALAKYWTTNEVEQFRGIIISVRAIADLVAKLNPEIVSIRQGTTNALAYDNMSKTLSDIQVEFTNLQHNADSFMQEIGKPTGWINWLKENRMFRDHATKSE